MDTEDGETPRHSVRVPDARWDRFGELAKAEGTDRAKKLNGYMQTEIDRHEKRAKRA